MASPRFFCDNRVFLAEINDRASGASRGHEYDCVIVRDVRDSGCEKVRQEYRFRDRVGVGGVRRRESVRESEIELGVGVRVRVLWEKWSTGRQLAMLNRCNCRRKRHFPSDKSPTNLRGDRIDPTTNDSKQSAPHKPVLGLLWERARQLRFEWVN